MKKKAAIIILIIAMIGYVIYRLTLSEGTPFSFEPMEHKLYEPKTQPK